MREGEAVYKERLDLQAAYFEWIDHEDTMVATVFKVTLPGKSPMILKICSRSGDYAREVYFLKHFRGLVPVPRLIQNMPPKADVHGAVLMECLPGRVLKVEDLNEDLAHSAGSLLAHIHFDLDKGYGDLTEPEQLSSDPRVSFTLKFEEGMEECSNHLPVTLLEKCRCYFNQHIDLLESTDGPRIVHRDFRPGNLLIDHGELQGVIDWSSARGGFAEEDFSPLELGEWSTRPSYKNTFLEGYAKVRKIPDYPKVMPLLRLSRAIGVIGFTVKRNIWQSKGAKMYQLNRQYLESFFSDS